jgi:uncharacterized membrane protein (TIGR02234 family)
MTAPKGRRLKLSLILLVLAASGLALLSWTGVWVHARLLTGTSGATAQNLDVPGSSAAPALTALALAGLALAGALTIAGPAIRAVLGVLQVLLGGCVAWTAVIAIGDPAAASASTVTAATGVAGEKSVLAGLEGAALTAWPFVALAAGIVMALAGVAILATMRSWPAATSRYQAARFAPAQGSEAPGEDRGATGQAAGSRAVDTWDDLSRGGDPTT